jgi:preprotein translocase subunit SecA
MNLTNFLNKKNIKKYRALIKQIHEYEEELYNSIPMDQVPHKLHLIKEDKNMKPRNKILHAMALARRASTFILGMSYYDVQLMGALALFDGCIAEMKTGEGKTLTCSAAVVSNFVLNTKTHVATANEYLAQRDQETLEPLYTFLGISSSYCVSSMEKHSKREAYKADVVYSTAQELGFDFLRDNLVYSKEEQMQPYDLGEIKAIIDEADFILIDEARTPLIISGESPVQQLEFYQEIRDFALTLTKMEKAPESNPFLVDEKIPGDFWVDLKWKSAYYSESGYNKIEDFFASKFADKGSVYNGENSWILQEVLSAIRAEHCYFKDKDYVVQDNEIVIVDANTGRLSKGRTWSNGLHQAIETKENVKVNAETITIGSISIQNYFRNYKQISGMSGTIMKSTEEFDGIYNRPTIAIPTNRPMIRIDHNDQIFLNLQAKYKAIISDIKTRHEKGQPILIGTTSVAESETISNLLKDAKIKHHVLNAKNHFWEAQIIAQAGQPYSVTVSTSMAGRGTDIILGGNTEALLVILHKQLNDLNERKSFFELLLADMEDGEDFNEEISTSEMISTDIHHIDHNEIQEYLLNLRNPDYLNKMFQEKPKNIRHLLHVLEQSILKQISIVEKSHEDWRKQVISLGGLYVLGSSRNESRRIDDQLRGRAGRQGDPGESIFYLSVEDPWVSVFGNNPIFSRISKGVHTDEAISAPIVNKAFEKAQEAIESFHYTSRKDTFQYDTVADDGRRHFLSLRNLLLNDEQYIADILQNTLIETYGITTQNDFPIFFDQLDIAENTLSADFSTHLEFTNYILKMPFDKIYDATNKYKTLYKIISKESDQESLNYLRNEISNIMLKYKDNKDLWNNLNQICLRALDKRWAEHLSFIDGAKEHVGLRSLAQKNPLYEFKTVCYDSFSSLIDDFKFNVVVEFKTLTEEKSELIIE